MNAVATPRLISVVVPSKDRHRYLSSLIASVLSFESQDIELIIHDNSEYRLELAVSSGAEDDRLTYVHDPSAMSMIDNFERALSYAKGEYVCMIGDDDGVTPSIVSVARWLKARGIGAAMTPVSTYTWPGVVDLTDEGGSGIIRFPRYEYQVDTILESDALDEALRFGGIRIGNMPSVYQGIVSRKALDSLIDLAGTAFPGPSPDMANAVGLSAVIDRFARISFPVVISGRCPQSGAAEGARHRHEGEIHERSFLPPDTAAKWPPEVPAFFSGPTLEATTLISALRATGRSEKLHMMRFDRLYAACIVFSPRYRGRVMDSRRLQPGLFRTNRLWMAIGWVWTLRIRALIANVGGRLRSPLFGDSYKTGLDDIEAAIEYVVHQFGSVGRILAIEESTSSV